ncbi:MAG: DUF1761 domain-containing protein [Patescibacteria group bacterium]
MEINFWMVLVAAVANFVIGFLFHGPLFGKTWMRLANVTPTGNEKLSDMVPQMSKNLLANIVFAYALAVFHLYAVTSTLSTGPSTAWNGMACGFLVWLGFVVTSSSMEVIWMKRSTKLWLFEMVASLVSILAMGAIIGASM